MVIEALLSIMQGDDLGGDRGGQENDLHHADWGSPIEVWPTPICSGALTKKRRWSDVGTQYR